MGPRRQQQPQAVNNAQPQVGWQPSQWQPQQSATSGEAPSGGDWQDAPGSVGDAPPMVDSPPQGYQPQGPQGGGGFQGRQKGPLDSLTNSLAQQIGSYAKPDTAGLKASQVDFYNSQKNNALEQQKQSAASRGASLSSPYEASREAQIGDQYTSNVGNAYRTIDQGAQQTGFQNLISALSGVGGLQSQNQNFGLAQELGRGNLGVAQGQLGVNQANATSNQNNQFLMTLLSLLNG